MEKINYKFMDNGTVRTGFWEGDPSEALTAAVEYFGAEYMPEDEAWMYRADDTGEHILVDEDELLRAGAAILSGAEDWYSIWCAQTGAPVGR